MVSKVTNGFLASNAATIVFAPADPNTFVKAAVPKPAAKVPKPILS